MKLNDRDLIRKETSFGIANHWTLAISCLILTLTGFAFLFHIEVVGKLFGGFPLMKDIHNWIGVIFTVSLFLSIFNWLKESITFDKDDIQWMVAAGGYLGKWWPKHAPPMHKLNTGQKLFYLTLLGCGAGIIATGFAIWLMPGYRALMILSHFLHNVCFIVISAFIPVHIYLGSVGNPGTLRIMVDGMVPVWWARKKAAKWIKEVEEGHAH
jgi:formate dehydrogenase subunit gamma